METTLELAGPLREAPVIDRVREGAIHRFGVCVVGHWLWKPLKKDKRARDPWGYALGHADHFLDVEHIMANTRQKKVAAHVTDALGNIVTRGGGGSRARSLYASPPSPPPPSDFER